MGVEGRKKPVIQCAERLNELTLPEVLISSSQPASFDVFLKPEWNGLGKNKTRPSFEVFIELVDKTSGEVHELCVFDTELQSHKFESSPKARSMENSSSCSSVKKTVNL